METWKLRITFVNKYLSHENDLTLPHAWRYDTKQE